MKTILITSFHPVISRNILRNGVLANLRRQNMSISVLVPQSKKHLYEDIASEGVTIIPVQHELSKQSRKGLFLKRLARNMLPTRTNAINQKVNLHNYNNYPKYFFYAGVRFLGRYGLVRRGMRYLDSLVVISRELEIIIRDRRPDLIFSTDIQNEADVEVIKLAKRHHIPVIGMVRSWDNLTVHGLIRGIPDRLIVWSDFMKDQAVRFHDIPKDRIDVIGVPHYDAYYQEPKITKQDFLERFFGRFEGRIPPCITFAPTGDRYVKKNDLDSHVLEMLRSAGDEVRILVRFPPNDSVDNMPERTTRLSFYQPGTHTPGVSLMAQELSKEDDELLHAMMWFSDIVVCGPSSIALDASICGTPVVMANFYPTPRPYPEQVVCYDYEHLQALLATGIVRYTDTKEQFARTITELLAKKGGTRSIDTRLAYLVGPTDGKAVKRLADILVNTII